MSRIAGLGNQARTGAGGRLSGEYSGLSLYRRQALGASTLTSEEEVELASRIKQGDQDARDRMIQANLKMVVGIAHRWEGRGVDLEDLIQAGSVGLMKAVERFDPTEGKLSTYAYRWIRGHIKQEIKQSRSAVRMPVNAQDEMNRIKRVVAELAQKLEREPSLEEQATALNLSPGQLQKLQLSWVRDITSLDQSISPDDDRDGYDRYADSHTVSPDKALAQTELCAGIRGKLGRVRNLSEMERNVIMLRFGISEDGSDLGTKTSEEIGRTLKISTSKVRQHENRALEKLRNLWRAEK